MSLSKDDLDHVKNIVQEVVQGSVEFLVDIMDKRFEQIDKRFEQVDVRFDQIDKRFAEQDKKFIEIFLRLDSLEKQIKYLAGEVEALTADVKELYKMNSLPKSFARMTNEQQIRTLYLQITKIAKAANVQL